MTNEDINNLTLERDYWMYRAYEAEASRDYWKRANERLHEKIEALHGQISNLKERPLYVNLFFNKFNH